MWIALFASLLLSYFFLRRSHLGQWLRWCSPAMVKARRIFNKLYQDTQTYAVSHQERKRLHLKDPEYIYGEVIFNSFWQLLSIVKPVSEDVFYDLGAGAGKAVIIMSLVYANLSKIIGLELLPALHTLSIEKLSELQRKYPSKGNNVEFIQADFMQYDFSDATIVFVNAAAFMPEFWQQLVHKFEQLKSGCRIIMTSKHLPADQYNLIHTGTHLMGWGDAGVNIYIKL